MTDFPSWAKVGAKCTPIVDINDDYRRLGEVLVHFGPLPRKGGEYTVASTVIKSDGLYIELTEVGSTARFFAGDFRPLTSTKTEAESLAYFTPFLSTAPSEADRIEREAQEELVDLALVQVNALWGKGA